MVQPAAVVLAVQGVTCDGVIRNMSVGVFGNYTEAPASPACLLNDADSFL